MSKKIDTKNSIKSELKDQIKREIFREIYLELEKKIDNDISILKIDMINYIKDIVQKEQNKTNKNNNQLLDQNSINRLSVVVANDIKKDLSKILIPMNNKIKLLDNQMEELLLDGDEVNNNYRKEVYEMYTDPKKKSTRLTFLDE